MTASNFKVCPSTVYKPVTVIEPKDAVVEDGL